MMPEMTDLYAALLSSANDTIRQLSESDPTPEFHLSIGWFENYDALFRGTDAKESELMELATVAIRTGRVILAARGGAAKTVSGHRLARALLERNALPVIVDLKQWRARNYDDWNALETPADRIDYLFTHFAPPRFTALALNALPPDVERVLFVDGLNEVMTPTAQQIITTFEEYVRYAIRTGMIVADRLVRRDFIDSKRWRFATILPLSQSEVQAQLESVGRGELYANGDAGSKALLSIPYFLNAALHSGDSATTSAQYFERHSGLKETDALDKAAKAAYDAYKKAKARTFEYAAFVDDAGVDIAVALRAAGVLIVQGDRAWFSHHLNHDYLVSRYLDADQNRWNPTEFDIVTFRASSFDVLALALQQLDDEVSADRFVRRIYDWNIYAAAYAIIEGRGQGTALAVSREMEFAIIAMLGLRRWDLIEATGVKAEDALSLFTSGPAIEVLSKATKAEVLQMVSAVESEKQWFIDWQTLLTKRVNVRESDLQLIEDTDSLRGWTFANVLRDMDLEPRLQGSLRELLGRTANETVRWRLVHVLGAYPTAENAAALLDRFVNEPPGWVRYGAIRALIEVAALGDSRTRTHIFSTLGRNLERLEQDERTLREFEDAVFIDPKRAPADWVRSLAEVIEGLYEREPAVDKRDRLQEIAFRLRGSYR